MKKISWLLTAVMLLSLTACSGSAGSVFEAMLFPGSGQGWTSQNRIYARTYKAVGRELARPKEKSENARAWLKDHSMNSEEDLRAEQDSFRDSESGQTVAIDDFLKYDEEEKMPVFDFSRIGTMDALRAAQALKEVWDGEDVPLWGAVVDESDSGLVMYEFFETFKCKSIELKLPMIYSVELPGKSAGNIRGLTSLVVERDFFDPAELSSPMEPCKKLTDLTCVSETSMEYSDEYFPKLKKLTLIAHDPSDIPEDEFVSSLEGTKISEISLYNTEGGDVESSLQSVHFFEQLKGIDNIEKINGKKKDKFDIPMSDEVRKELEEKKEAEEAEALLDEIKENLKDCEGQESKDEEGTPHLGRKLIVSINDNYSLESARKGEDFEGIPADRLAVSYEEADTYLCINPVHQMAGTYTNGAIGYKTYTMVITYDLKNGNERAAKCVATDDPPQTITVYNNIPVLSSSGDFMKDEALEYVMSLLEEEVEEEADEEGAEEEAGDAEENTEEETGEETE